MLCFQKYIKISQNVIVNHYKNNKNKIHWYTKSLNNKNYILDENYHLIKYNWIDSLNLFSVYNLKSHNNNILYINTTDFVYSDIQNIFSFLKKLKKNVFDKKEYDTFLSNNFTVEKHTIVNSNFNNNLNKVFTIKPNFNYKLYNKFYSLY